MTWCGEFSHLTCMLQSYTAATMKELAKFKSETAAMRDKRLKQRGAQKRRKAARHEFPPSDLEKVCRQHLRTLGAMAKAEAAAMAEKQLAEKKVAEKKVAWRGVVWRGVSWPGVTTYYLLLTALLRTTYYILLASYYLLLTTYYSQPHPTPSHRMFITQ